VSIDREVKTPTGAFIEGFIKASNDTEGPSKPEDKLEGGDERFDAEQEFEFAQMISQRR
jgi:hypothetical protein